MENTTNKTVVLITRYNEYIDWIRYIVNNVDFIFVYNKGQNTNYFNLHLVFNFIPILLYIIKIGC